MKTLGDTTRRGIVDTGAGVSIVNHSVLQAWGNPPIEPVHFNLTVADGYKVRPMGVLRDWPVKIAGVLFKVNFVIMKGVDYDLLLGRP